MINRLGLGILYVIIVLSHYDAYSMVFKNSTMEREMLFIYLSSPTVAAPTCRDTSITIATNYNYVLDLTLLTSDSDGDLPASAYTISSNPLHGSASVNSLGIANYNSQFNYTGQDSFTYTATDNSGSSCSGTISITLGCPVSIENHIYGTIFSDYNQDGLVNNNDNSFSGPVNVHLYEDNNPADGTPDGPAIQTSISNVNGNYSFSIFHDYYDTIQNTYYLNSFVDDAREKKRRQHRK